MVPILLGVMCELETLLLLLTIILICIRRRVATTKKNTEFEVKNM